MLINKRREARIKPARQLPARLYGQVATVLDLSRSGCLLEVALPDEIIPTEHGEIEATFELNGRLLVVSARVIHYRGRGRAGASQTRYLIAVAFRPDAFAAAQEIVGFASGSSPAPSPT